MRVKITDMKYCSNCSKSIQLKKIKDDSIPRYACDSCGVVHYQNPNIVSGCIVYHENKVLLCRRAIEPRRGYWNLPAGYLENGESVEEGAIREVWEEAEAKVDIKYLHCLYDLTHVNQVYLLFVAALKNKQFSCGVESLEVGLFAEEDIPWKEIAFGSTTFALKRYFSDQKTAFTNVHIGGFPAEE